MLQNKQYVMLLNWGQLHKGKLKQHEIQISYQDEDWQTFRKSLKGISTEKKFEKLQEWLNLQENSNKAQIQVTNYINALKRGGII